MTLIISPRNADGRKLDSVIGDGACSFFYVGGGCGGLLLLLLASGRALKAAEGSCDRVRAIGGRLSAPLLTSLS